MITLLQICLLMMLGYVFLQDARSRLIYLWCFPVLAMMFVVLRVFNGEKWASIAGDSIKGLLFLLLQIVALSLYFSIRNRKWTNILKGYLGWGDVLFLICSACYLSILNFIGFYVGSLLLSIIVWIIWQQRKDASNNVRIPLAGLQALIMMPLLLADWWLPGVSLTQDDWLISLIAG
ncbi:hypothetical protein IM792_16165 [Mucilaginibacter sp. JRF]|uniref:hypothetical protein n=1 Tax=Mucilaginibacter sp. JRF TaxID=2780088 RepID=UPI00187DFE39|nr:hypothetical protein [Mucilaginibacter sp. JRF]MBE9585990.1 hypothetical protein [Mucilaginibacter sp. JRF]